MHDSKLSFLHTPSHMPYMPSNPILSIRMSFLLFHIPLIFVLYILPMLFQLLDYVFIDLHSYFVDHATNLMLFDKSLIIWFLIIDTKCNGLYIPKFSNLACKSQSVYSFEAFFIIIMIKSSTKLFLRVYY